MKKGNHGKEVDGFATDSGRQGLRLGKALDAAWWPQPWAQTVGLGQGAGCSPCGSSPSLSWLQSRERRSLTETELETQVQEETRS